MEIEFDAAEQQIIYGASAGLKRRGLSVTGFNQEEDYSGLLESPSAKHLY